MKLVKNARKAYAWLSMQAMAVTVMLQGAWIGVPDDLKSSLPGWAAPVIAIVILVFGMVGRLVVQGPEDE